MWTYPWDVIDEGVDRVVGFLKDEIGLDAISLSSVYHSYDALRTHLPARDILVSSEAAIYFQPELGLYRDTPIQPNVHPMARDRDVQTVISKSCSKRGLGLIAWIVPLHTHVLARKHSDCAPRGVFGDRYPGSLCPANPHVREYVRALSRDLDRNHELELIEFESLHYMGFGMFKNSRKVGVDLGAVGHFLMSLCFCPACLHLGNEQGIDVAGIKSRVRSLLIEIFEAGPPELSVADFVSEDPSLEAFVRMRADVVTTLAAEVRAAVETPVSFLYMGDYLHGGIEREAIEAIVDRVNVLCYGSSPEQASRTIRETIQTMADPGKLICGLQGHHPIDSSELMLGMLQTVYENGARRFSYYNYGMISLRNLAWIKEAIATVRAIDRDASH